MAEEIHSCFLVQTVLDAEEGVGVAAGMGRELAVGVHGVFIEEGVEFAVAEVLGIPTLSFGGGAEVVAGGLYHSFIYRDEILRDDDDSILSCFGLTSGRVDQTLV